MSAQNDETTNLLPLPESGEPTSTVDPRLARVRSAQSDLTKIESKIESLEAELANLRRQRRSLQITIEQSHSEGSPIRKLPGELLSQIFMEVLRSYIGSELGWTDRDILLPRAPFLFCEVCRYWNDLVISTPTFWSAFILNLDALKCPTNAEKLLERFLTLSASSLLDISIVQTLQGTSIPTDQADVLKDMVLHSADRIKTLAMVATTDPFSSKSVTFPNLTHYHHFQFGEQHIEGYSWLRSAPNLRDVRLKDGTLNRWVGSALDSDHGTIKTLSARSYGLDQGFNLILPHTKDLEVLILEINSRGVPGAKFPHLAPLQNTKEIYVDFTYYESSIPDQPWSDPFATFWESITTPNLSLLRFMDSDEPKAPARQWNHAAFTSFISRSQIGENLRVLLMSSTFMTDDDAIAVCEGLPNLEVLALSTQNEKARGICATSTKFIGYLTPSAMDGENEVSSLAVLPLPRVRVLRFSISGTPEEFEKRMNAVALLAERRCRIDPRYGQRLEGLDLWIDIPVTDEKIPALDRLHKCRKYGLRFKVP